MSTWKYQSYRPEPGALDANQNPPNFICWSPPDKGVVTISDDWTTGTLEFTGTPIKLALKIQVTEGNPRRVSILATMKLSADKEFTNELQGWFVPSTLGLPVGPGNPLVVRGSIVQTSEVAPDKQPIFTAGFFVLEPVQSA